MMRRWFKNNRLSVLQYGFGLLIAVVAFWGFIVLYKEGNWIGISALATLMLAFAAFLTISANRYTRKEDREKERKARSAEELCRWAEEALRLYYLPFNYHKDEINNGFIALTIKNMLMVIAATIIGNEFIELTKRAENALVGFYGIIKGRYYQKVTKPVDKTILKEFEDAFYTLLSYLYVLRLWDYDYDRFLADAIENGKLEPKYKLPDEEDIGSLAKEDEKKDLLKSDSNNQEPLSFKPLPWGVLFFGFWASLRTIENPALIIHITACFFLGLSAILLLAAFTKPFYLFLQKIITTHSPRLSKILTSQNVNGIFVLLVFFATLIGFPVNIIMSLTNLEVIDVSIAVIGLFLWTIAYMLILASIISRMGRTGQIIGGVISALILWSAKNAFTSDTLAGWILIGLGVILIIVVIVKPKTWDLWQMV